MSVKRQQHGAGFKARVALAAFKGDRTVGMLASQFAIHPAQIHKWKRQLLDGVEHVFVDQRSRAAQEEQIDKAELYEQIGRLQMELAWLKKKVAQFD
jgi:transposase-like protein